MKELQDREADVLLPGRSRDVFVVLFWRGSAGSLAELRTRCAEVTWPRGFRVVCVDLDAASEVDEWFKPGTLPMLAVVHDGALLSMEFDFSDEACVRLAECGRAQYSLMLDALSS